MIKNFIKTTENPSLSTYDADHLDRMAQIEENHFWFEYRRNFIAQMFQRFVEKSARILEIGSGTGYVASYLQSVGYKIECSDLYANGLRIAESRGIEELYQFDLFDSPFKEEFDVICLFDVLEHLQDPIHAIRCIKGMLKPKGLILLTVPAHPWLWSRDDVIAGHQKRYTKKILAQELCSADVKLLYTQYFFSSLLPFLMMRKWLKQDDQKPLRAEEEISWKLSRWQNDLFKLWMRTEKLWPKGVGGSLVAVAENDHQLSSFS